MANICKRGDNGQNSANVFSLKKQIEKLASVFLLQNDDIGKRYDSGQKNASVL
jgi:hypothetical protein